MPHPSPETIDTLQDQFSAIEAEHDPERLYAMDEMLGQVTLLISANTANTGLVVDRAFPEQLRDLSRIMRGTLSQLSTNYVGRTGLQVELQHL